MSDEVTDADLIDLTYLPFTREEVLERFAPVAGAGQIDRWLTHYLDSTANHRSFIAANAGADAPISDLTLIRRGRQIEKDERFWVVAALMAIFQSAEARIDEFSALLTKCFGMKPPVADFDSWRDALGRDLQLYFEVNLASPKDYRVELQKHLEDHLLDIPYIREAALTRGERLEGATKVDAILIAKDTGFNVLFEAKVLSDTWCKLSLMLPQSDSPKYRCDAREAGSTGASSDELARPCQIMLCAPHAGPLSEESGISSVWMANA